MFNYVKKGDILLVIILFLMSIALLFFIYRPSKANVEVYASIQLDGNKIRTVDLSSENAGETIRIDSEYGYNVFEIGDNKIRSIDADCKEKIHIKQGWISKPGQTLVCLPHRLVVEIKSLDANSSEIDHINF